MLKRLSDPRFATISTPSKDAVALLKTILETNPEPVVAEIGVGVGATSYALANMLNGKGSLELFDYEKTLDELKEELDEENIKNVLYRPNSRKTFDSYNWTLVKLLREQKQSKKRGTYDFVYLDGAHAFQHDAPASVLIKDLLKPGGYLLFDDLMWTFGSSPTANPTVNKFTAEHYSEEQIYIPHIKLVCEFFFDEDDRFRRVDLGYKSSELRRAYQKIVA